ncbi:uncharacterized protein EAE97_012103 [Botrytis byssoidea]|uniref:Zn(2)-C6 fungal-type domain-containing protein n=1 Tax=Botrytis byssoidea TaxID=139641 RepID=A0A9P5HLI4_9HELO|nr:uncharacterized protein EAE97_012103 [Botrytis byssoidea]KAF7916443.1 hypothetical protein EAE97_012103 [Botrytis byssoidea]
MKPKNGCNTCKLRRVKCDETKPGCTRCQNFGRVCDGYELKSPSHEPAWLVKDEGSSLSAAKIKKKPIPVEKFLSVPRARTALIRHLGPCENCQERNVKCPLEHHDLKVVEMAYQNASRDGKSTNHREGKPIPKCKSLNNTGYHANKMMNEESPLVYNTHQPRIESDTNDTDYNSDDLPDDPELSASAKERITNPKAYFDKLKSLEQDK